MEEVISATNEFLLCHWDTELLDTNEVPGWESYSFQGNIPKGNRQGCYALIAKTDVIYIGLGASRGSGLYTEHGVGARLMNHVLKWDRSRPASISDRYFIPRSKWADVTEIYTIGFPRGYGYMACSLEAYLLSKLKPLKNVNRPGSSSKKTNARNKINSKR